MSPQQRLRLEYMPLEELTPADRNPKGHAPLAIDGSMKRFGYMEPVLLDERTGKLVAGHGRRENLLRRREAGEGPPDWIVVKGDAWLVPVTRGWRSRDDADALAAGVAVNRAGELGGWLPDLGPVLEELGRHELGLEGVGFTPDELDDLLRASTDPAGPAGPRTERPSLADRFVVPPFSVLDARQGYWQARKAQWLGLGIRSEEGRPGNLLSLSAQAEDIIGRHKRSSGAYGAKGTEQPDGSIVYETTVGATSIFDPVVCELAYRWFCPPGGSVLDPFAGGSVRGIVAALLGRGYTGCELRPEQVAANRSQAQSICPEAKRLEWLAGDCADLIPGKLAKRPPVDFLFSCPPYWNLEGYSEDPRDLSSAATWEAFGAHLAAIVAASCELLAEDRFACFVVGNLRADGGSLLDLGALTRSAFEAAGLSFYNDAILVTAVGSLALRAGLNFRLRKLGRCHQQVLVFLKGDARRAVEACGDVVVEDAAALFGEPLEP